MKVLFIAKNIPRPGRKGNKIILTIAEKLSEFCDISILRPREKVPFWLKHHPKYVDLVGLKEWETRNFKITTFPYINIPFRKARYWLLFRLSKFGKEYIENNKFDLIHAHYLFPDGQIAYHIKKIYEIPYVLTFRNQDKQYLELISTQNPDYYKASKIIRSAKQVLVPNSGYKDFVESNFNVSCSVMPHGIEQEAFLINHVVKGKKELTILSVADKLPTKNVDWVIRGLKSYSGEQPVKLKLIGEVCNREDIIELSKHDERIELMGRIPREEVLNYMKKSDIFALPSSKETFGLVYLEAAATSNAIIGYRGEGVWGVFDENEEMLFCENFEEFQSQLHSLLEDKNLGSKLAEKVHKKAKTMRWENVTKHYFAVYKNSINNTKRNDF
uniref:glycosyltransferase family 4 protein n=1 Tax=uncultured Draconibacterium sp. TaxID=1573823 RepID=UPI0032173385